MPSELPSAYTTLMPFDAWFADGVPALMYHKLGPRPPGVRLRGMYVGARLFERQLSELRAAGYRSCGIEETVATGEPKRIALTFDDGYVNALHHGLPALQRHGFQAIQYLVADRLGGTNDWDVANGEAPEGLMDAAGVREWLSGGQVIGSHSCTHPMLTRLPPQRAREEIGASRRKLEDLFGVPVLDFCYPSGDWNQRIADLVQEAGYRSACTTAWGLNTPATSPFSIARVMARHRSWGSRATLTRVRRLLGGKR